MFIFYFSRCVSNARSCSNLFPSTNLYLWSINCGASFFMVNVIHIEQHTISVCLFSAFTDFMIFFTSFYLLCIVRIDEPLNQNSLSCVRFMLTIHWNLICALLQWQTQGTTTIFVFISHKHTHCVVTTNAMLRIPKCFILFCVCTIQLSQHRTNAENEQTPNNRRQCMRMRFCCACAKECLCANEMNDCRIRCVSTVKSLHCASKCQRWRRIRDGEYRVLDGVRNIGALIG